MASTPLVRRCCFSEAEETHQQLLLTVNQSPHFQPERERVRTCVYYYETETTARCTMS